MKHRFSALIAGFGQIAAGYAEDRRYLEHVSCPTHAHALQKHPGFQWMAVVDPAAVARDNARRRWAVPHVAVSAAELDCAGEIEVAVLATPPDVRMEIIECLPNLKAVLVEKPLASSLAAARRFLDVCRERGILVQVNITRRGDSLLRELATGGFAEIAGDPRVVFGVYGNGLANMATHSVDLVRMLLGEIRAVQALPGGISFEEGPLAGDVNLSFALILECGVQAVFQPVRFSEYRETGLDIWGSKGRIQLVQEGLVLLCSGVEPCRSFSGAYEIPSDRPVIRFTRYGEALYAMYDNLYQVLLGGGKLLCPGEEALATMRVLEAVVDSYRRGGAIMDLAAFSGGPFTLYYAHDPGAAELIAYLYSRRDKQGAILLAQGYAGAVFCKLGLCFEEMASTRELLEWLEVRGGTVERIVSGTSQSADADCQLWRRAAELNIPVEVHVDHWMYLLERFNHLGSLMVPQQVHVVDTDSRKKLLQAGFPEEIVVVSGQPVLEVKGRAMKEIRCDPAMRCRVLATLGLDATSPLNVFVSENLTELGLRAEYGFDELDSFQAYRAELGMASVVVKVHPKESEDKWRAFFERQDIHDCLVISRQIIPEELVAVADTVGGIYSILLLQANLAGVPVASYQPALKIDNPMASGFAAGIRTVLDDPSKKEMYHG